MMRNIYVLYCHPDDDSSRVNRAKRDAISDLRGVEIRDLYADYADGQIDKRRERDACERADIIVFQFPLYWYSVPPLLRVWQDEVLEHSWAFGRHGKALSGKGFLIATSVGAPEQDYQTGDRPGVPLDALCLPLTKTASYCSMVALPIQAEFGVFGYGTAQLFDCAERYRRRIIALRDGMEQLKAL